LTHGFIFSFGPVFLETQQQHRTLLSLFFRSGFSPRRALLQVAALSGFFFFRRANAARAPFFFFFDLS
jgi:hypothetical protein